MANTVLKTSLCGVSTLCAVLAIALAGGGIWWSLKLKEITDLRNFESIQLDFEIHWPQILPVVFVAVGILAILVALCGFCGSAGNKPCLVIYSVCLVIVILGMVGLGIAAVMVGPQQSKDFIQKTLHNVFSETKEKLKVREQFSMIESNMHCCGADGPNDYQGDFYQGRLPPSCCDGGICANKISRRPGCIKVYAAYTSWAFYIGAAGCGLVTIFAILSLALSIAFTRQITPKVIS